MSLNVVKLTQELVAIQSESCASNTEVSAVIAQIMDAVGFDVERLSYDDGGVEKVCLVAKLGSGHGGLGFFGHSDTVPGGEGWEPFIPHEQDGKLYGRGSCDMKGPVAAMLVAAAGIDPSTLRRPLYVVVTSDEEVGHVGAQYVVAKSSLLSVAWPDYCVVGEPTELTPVYAHKGGYRIHVTASGVAAHTSTERGRSANFVIAPFLAEMAELVPRFKTDQRFLDYEFDPPSNGFNLVLDDGGTAANVTASRTLATLSLRAMPDAHAEEAVEMIERRAKAHGLEVKTSGFPHFYVSPDAEVVKAACKATGRDRAVTVPFGTEAVWYQGHTQTVVLGPGNVAQAHTIGEWIEVAQLHDAVAVYKRMIADVCMAAR